MRTLGLVVVAVVGCMLAPGLASARTRCFTPPAQPGALTSAELTQLQTCVTNLANTARSRAASIASAVADCSAGPSVRRFPDARATLKQTGRLYAAYLQGEKRYYAGRGRQAVANKLATLSQKLSQLVSTLYTMYLGRDAAASAIGSGNCAQAQSKLATLQQKAQIAKQQLAAFRASLAQLQ